MAAAGRIKEAPDAQQAVLSATGHQIQGRSAIKYGRPVRSA